MSLSRHRNAALALALTALAPTSRAQYPGHSDPKIKPGPVLRSIAVLEWTGEPGKPSASRLIPVTVFHDGEYEAGDLYLARPEPLALDTGTEYLLQKSGEPTGVFDIASAQQLGPDWFGYGTWKPLPPPEAVHPLHESRVTPEVIDGGDDRRPHFRKAAPASQDPNNPQAENPPDDPDRPNLHKRPASKPDSSSTANPETSAATGDLETSTAGADPDRPKLTRGIPKDQPTQVQHLEGTPASLEQMIAVSDATTREPHDFAYSWSSPDESARFEAALTTIAQQAIAKFTKQEHPSTPARPTTAAHHTTAARTAAKATHHATAAKPPSISLVDISFRAFELTYSGGSTLVLSARTADADDLKVKYVTVIAQPDIYGTPQVLYTRVTRGDDLDANPRMRLVDAVDAAGDNRGDLLFELRGSTIRQFAIYRVASGRVDQMIATNPLPLTKGSG